MSSKRNHEQSPQTLASRAGSVPSESMMADRVTLREVSTDAIRYWELRRLAHNAVLAAIVVGFLIAYWPESRAAIRCSASAAMRLSAS